MIDEEKLREEIIYAKEALSGHRIKLLIELANQVLSAEWPKRKEHTCGCQALTISSECCHCGAFEFNSAIDLCRLAAAKDRLKMVSVDSMVGIMRDEANKAGCVLGAETMLYKAATAIHAKIYGEAKNAKT